MAGKGRGTLAALTATVVGGVTLLATGCGSESGRPAASIRSVPTNTGARPAADLPRTGPIRRAKPRARKKGTAINLAAATPLEQAARRSAQNLTASKRSGLVTTVTRAVLARFGFTPQAIVPTSAGNSVRIVLRAGEACTATPGTERSVAAMVQKGVPWLRSVQVLAGSRGIALSQFVRSNCGSVGLPSGSGPALLTSRGSALGSTAAFTVGSRRWSIEYLNDSRLLQILVLKNGAPTGSPFVSQKRGPGRFVVSGAGSFSLQVISIGSWTVRVRDGV